MATPITEKTTEKPKTKNTEFNIMLVLLTTTVPSWDLLMSASVVPDIYAKNAGIMGRIHGAQNEPSPANAAMANVTSTMIL